MAILKKPNAQDIQFGDLMEYVEPGLIKTPYMRVLGRLTDHNARFHGFGPADQPLYIGFVEGPRDVNGKLCFDISDEVRGWIDWGQDLAMAGKMELDMGHIPDRSELPKRFYWFAAPWARLACPFGDSMYAMFVKNGWCPRCGDHGSWKALALSCPWHGMYM